MNAIERAARLSDPGYLEKLWRETNGDWMTPTNESLRAFLSALSRDAEGA